MVEPRIYPNSFFVPSFVTFDSGFAIDTFRPNDKEKMLATSG
jgi:hypothetical protein